MDQKTQTLGASCLCKNSSFSKCYKWHLYNYVNYRDQNFSSISCYLLELLPQNTPQNGPNWVLNQKKWMLLPSKVENGKYPEDETWYPESLDEWSYYRLCENAWWPFGVAPWGNFLGVFLLNFTRILWSSWDLGLMLFDIPKNVVFAEILVFSNVFGFRAVNWTPKMYQNCKLWVCTIWAKMQSEGFFEDSVCLIGD